MALLTHLLRKLFVQSLYQAHMVEQPKTDENLAIGGFNSEEIEKFRSLLGSLDKPTGTCSLAISGTPSLSFCLNAAHRVYGLPNT